MFDVAGGARCREDVAQRRGYSDRSNAERGQAFLSDGHAGCGFDDRRLGLVGDQLAQERNQHDELSWCYT
jgi:hypothetical protein